MLAVPLIDSDDWVAVPLDQLPENHSEVTNVLTAELAPLEVWLQFALEYFKRDKIPQFEAILATLDSEDAQRAYADDEYKEGKIAILNAQAAGYISQGIAATSAEKKTQLFEQATARLNKSISIGFQEATTWNCQGLLALARYAPAPIGKKDNMDAAAKRLKEAASSALVNFRNALSLDPVNIPALLGLANCHVHLGQYDQALTRYFHALKLNAESLPACVRCGIGICYFRLKDYERAQAAFERALALEPQDEIALSSLAVLELNATEPDPERVVSFIQRAYEANPHHVPTLLLAADHLFYQRKFVTAGKLLQRALRSANTNALVGNTHFQLARMFHEQHKFKNALNHYTQALEFLPEYPLALFGAGQVALQEKQLTLAIKYIEQVHEMRRFSQNFDVLRVLGSLYGQIGQNKKAEKLLLMAHQLAPSDVDVLLELGQISETVKPQQSYTCYKQALALMRREKLHIPSQLWNNCGVVAQTLGKLDEARTAFLNSLVHKGSKSGILAAESGTPSSIDENEQVHAVDVTAVYNLAVNAALQGDYDKADYLHQYILAGFPAYVDSQLHMVSVSLEANRLEEARKRLDPVLEKDSKNVTALSLLAHIHIANNDTFAASKIFEQILTTGIAPDDPFSKIGFGVLKLTSIKNRKQLDLQTSKKVDAKKELALDFKSAQKAGAFFRSVLKRDSANVHAAMGLGVALAYQGNLVKARDVFLQCRDSSPDILDVWVNLGHVYSKEKAWENAVTTYRHCVDKFEHVDIQQHVQLLLYLAHAMYQNGAMEDCKQVLETASHMEPENDNIWYDLAITQENYAISIIQLARTERTLRQVESAVNDLQSAHKVLLSLAKRHRSSAAAAAAASSNASSSSSSTDTPAVTAVGNQRVPDGFADKVGRHLEFVRGALDAARPHLDDAKKREHELMEQQLKTLADTKMLEEQEAAAKAAKLAAEQAEADRLEQLALATREKLAKLKEEVTTEHKMRREEAMLRVVPLTEEEIAANAAKKPKRQAKIKKPSKRSKKQRELEENDDADSNAIPTEEIRLVRPDDASDDEEEEELKRMRDAKNPVMAALVAAQKAKDDRRNNNQESSSSSSRKKKRGRLQKKVSDDEDAMDDDVPPGQVDEDESQPGPKKKRKLLTDEDE